MMKLNVYEVGVDPLPEIGSSVVLFDNKLFFGTQVSDCIVSGEVLVNYGDFADTLKEALESTEVDIDGECCDVNGNYTKLSYYVDTEEKTLLRGVRWMYEHELLTAINSEIEFPFQTHTSLTVALKKKWIYSDEILSQTEKLFDGGRHIFTTVRYIYNGKPFVTRWVSYDDYSNITFIGFGT